MDLLFHKLQLVQDSNEIQTCDPLGFDSYGSQPENLFVATCFSASWSHNNLWALPELGFRGSALHSKLLRITSVLSNAIEAHRTS
jgi:hypothetical protein